MTTLLYLLVPDSLEAGKDSESDGGRSASQLIDDFHSMTLNSFCEPAFQRRVRNLNVEIQPGSFSHSLPPPPFPPLGDSHLITAYRDNALHSEMGGVCST